MTCIDCLPLLPLRCTNDLPAAQAEVVDAHLKGCQSCRREAAGLRQTLAKLGELPAAEAPVDMPRLFGALQAAEARRARRWRRGAFGAGALAAAVLLLFLVRLEIRLEPRQVVLAWGAEPRVESSPPRPPSPRVGAADEEPLLAQLGSLNDKLKELEEQIGLALYDAAQRDKRRGEELAALRRTLELVRASAAAGIAAAERDLSALYAVHFPKKPGNPGDHP